MMLNRFTDETTRSKQNIWREKILQRGKTTADFVIPDLMEEANI